MGYYHCEGSLSLRVPTCAAGMVLLLIVLINDYPTAKPRQPKNCPLTKARGTRVIYAALCGEACGRVTR